MRRAHWLRYLCAPIARSPLSVSPIRVCVFLCRQWNKVVLAFITRVHVCVCAVVFMPWALGLGAHTHMEHNTPFGCPARAAVRAAVHLACQSVVALIGWTVLRSRLTDSAQTHSPSRSSASDQHNYSSICCHRCGSVVCITLAIGILNSAQLFPSFQLYCSVVRQPHEFWHETARLMAHLLHS